MKKILFALLSVALLSTACEKNVDAGPGGHTAPEAVGKWMYGSFAMSDFWSYDGAYQGKPFELAVVFDFKQNGTYEKYFVSSARDYSSCRTEAFTYEKGRVEFNETSGSFTLTPTDGKYRGFYSCAPNRNFDRKMEPSEMKVQTYYYEITKGTNGKPNLVVKFNQSDSNISTFLPTSW
ncbi:hypothetical protein [Salmonirosea aquatica]|uniref:Lipoprotein n=1 Tax=Salmonirosea aquatica TaxID=2654236 RepID=A0A7C9BLI4_9BACT|nr:hypothetical protein [Cytophagaceae bacterium SJW1-29]